jgi:D-glycero-D-manno-heptose 1,7-bisphosphate phosphatase
MMIVDVGHRGGMPLRRSESGLTQAVIYAGGRGTRLGALTDDVPKPLVTVAGRPFLDHQMELLRANGITDVVLLAGYQADKLTAYVGDGSRWNLRARCAVTPPAAQTMTRLRAARHLLDDVVLTVYCDNYVPFDLADRWRRYRESGATVQVTAYANDDGFTANNMTVDPDGRVRAYDPGRSRPGLNRVDLGFAIVDLGRLGELPADDRPFEHVVYPGLAKAGALSAYVTAHRYYGVGATARLPLAERFFARIPTVILDRDGVLNRRAPKAEYIVEPDDFHWLDGALEALRLFAHTGHRILVVTNQAGIARGMMTPDQLSAVHRKMVDEAAAAGAHIERVYHCPHGWDDGCACRKPAPGMLQQAQRDYDLDLSRTVFIGDDDRDRQAAAAAGCGYRHVDSSHALLDVARRITDRMIATT